MNIDGILKCLQKEDLPESMGLFVDLFEQCSIDEIQKEKFYVGDGLDVVRYAIKFLGGLSVVFPQVKSIKQTTMRFIDRQLRDCPDVHVHKLSKDTELNERTVKEYMKELGR